MALRIGFDVDGVLADFRSAFHAAAVRVLRREIARTSDSPQGAGALAEADVRRVWDEIAKTRNWWMGVEPYEPELLTSDA